MVFNAGSVQGYLRLNTTGWTTPMRGANASLTALSTSFTRMGMVAVGSLLLIEREFGKFDKAMRHATSVSETTNEEYERMSDMALDASVKWNKAAANTAQAFYWLGSAGLSVTEQMEAFNDTIMLSRAMGSGLDLTVEGLINITRAFGLEFANTREIADQLTKTVVSSNLDFEDLNSSLSYASSTARMTNNTLAETSAMLGVMADAGIKGCYDDQTEVLVKRGWVAWKDANMDDEFATCNPATNALEYQKPIRLIQYHHTGKMYHVTNRGVDQCVTPNHRMWVKKRGRDEFVIQEPANIIGKDIQYRVGGLAWRGDDADTITIKGFEQSRGSWTKTVPDMQIDSAVWAEFLGWYISEGSCDLIQGNYRVRITQNLGVVRDRMREELEKLPVVVNEYGDGFTFANEQIWRMVEPLGKAPQKHVPEYAMGWSPRLLSILLNAMMEGDGDVNGCYYTSSKVLADQVVEIALKMGVSATLVLKSKEGTISNYDKEGRAITAHHDQWKVSVKRTQLEPAYYPSEYRGVHGKRLDGSKFPAVSEWVDYDGEVFCAEVPNHLLVVRRNGKPVVSGNSMAGTTLRRAMTNLMSPTAEMADLLHTLNINIYDSTGKMKPFIDIMGQISDKVAGVSDKYKNMTFEVLFGRRAIAGQISLFNYGSVALRKYANDIKNAAGITERVAGKQMKAFTEVLGQLWREVQRVGIALGKTLAPAIERVANHLRANLALYEDYVKANGDAVMATMKWVAILGAASLILPPLLLMAVNLTNQFTQLTLTIVKMGAALLSNPLMWLAVALYTLRATFATDFWQKAWDNQIKPFLILMGDMFTQTITQICWEISLIPAALEKSFSGSSVWNTITYFIKGLQQIMLLVRMMNDLFAHPFTSWGDTLSPLLAQYEKLDEEMRVLFHGSKDESGRSNWLFASAEDRLASYREYAANFKVVGSELERLGEAAGVKIVAFGKEMGEYLGKALTESFEKDVAALSGITAGLMDKLPPNLRENIDNLMKAINVLKDAYKIFRNEPAGSAFGLPGISKDWKTKMKGAYEAVDKLWQEEMEFIYASMHKAGVWEDRWFSGVTTTLAAMHTWQDGFAQVNEEMRAEWSTTIEDLISGGSNLKDFFEDMFLGILNSFNRLLSQVLASDLWYSLFGQGEPLPWGTMTLLHKKHVAGGGTMGIFQSLMQSNILANPPSGVSGIGMDFMAQKPANVVINVENRGTPANLRVTGQHFDGKQFVVSAVMEEFNTNPNFRNALGR